MQLQYQSLTNTKRLGRYHGVYSNNSDNDSTSQPHFSELAFLHKDHSRITPIDFGKTLFGSKRTSFEKVLADAKRTIEKSTQFINKLESRELSCYNRAKSIPENATIRKEYIKCGKQMCEQKHGPYYYAYWKDPESKKLKKKYIGDQCRKIRN